MPPPQLHHQPEQEQPTFYDPALAFPPPTYHGQAQIDPTATWAGGLPEDDDPLLQRRLQQLVEQHRPSSRNVLRELADVAEQQSGSKRKGAFDDEDADDLSMEAAAAATDEDLASSRNKDGNKRRQDSLLPGFISRARRQMDEVLAKRNTLRSSVRSLENQLKNIQKLYEDEKAQLNEMDRVVYETGKELCDELLEENTTWNQLVSVSVPQNSPFR
jgi:chromosome segregation ATPase